MSQNSPDMSGSVIGGNMDGSTEHLLSIEQQNHHHPLPVIPALYTKLLAMIVLITGGFLIPVLHKNNSGTDTFSGLQYLHVIIWAITTVLTWYVKAEHKKSRIIGYHNFYNLTRYLHRIAFYILSAGNVILMVIGCLVRDYCMGGSTSRCSLNLPLSPVNYQQFIFIIEVIIAIPFLIKHIVDVVRFNTAQAPPDALADDLALRLSTPQSYVGVRGPSDMELVLERQADLLQVLRHRNAVLTQQIYSLTSQLHNQASGSSAEA